MPCKNVSRKNMKAVEKNTERTSNAISKKSEASQPTRPQLNILAMRQRAYLKYNRNHFEKLALILTDENGEPIKRMGKTYGPRILEEAIHRILILQMRLEETKSKIELLQSVLA